VCRPDNLRAAFLQPLQRLNTRAVCRIELCQIEMKRFVRSAYAKQVRDLYVCEASSHPHDVVPGIISDVDPAIHVFAAGQCNRRAIGKPAQNGCYSRSSQNVVTTNPCVVTA
jgi:hypothetical protein